MKKDYLSKCGPTLFRIFKNSKGNTNEIKFQSIANVNGSSSTNPAPPIAVRLRVSAMPDHCSTEDKTEEYNSQRHSSDSKRNDTEVKLRGFISYTYRTCQEIYLPVALSVKYLKWETFHIMIVQIVLVIVTAVQVNSQELCPSVCQLETLILSENMFQNLGSDLFADCMNLGNLYLSG